MNRKTPATFAAALAFVIALGALAWACTPQTVITQLRPLSGPAGTTLAISGSTPAPTEIRWNSTEGSVLANASGANFSVTASIPADAKPGVYYLISNGRALETFEVTSAGQASVPQAAQTDLWSGFKQGSAQSLGTEPAPSPSGHGMRSMGLAFVGLGLGAGFTAIAVLGTRRGRSKVSAKR